MISQTHEYALRVVVHLASQGGTMQTTRQIARVTKVPIGYLSKVLQTLGHAGIVIARRGLHGGFMLARPPEKLSVFDVVEAVEPLPRIRHCPLKLERHRGNLCALHRRLDETLAQVEKAFRDSTIAELLVGREGRAPLCSLMDATVDGRKRR
jgi:Rrf2 family protein